MFLQIMPLPRDIRDRRDPRAQLDPSDFADRRVGFTRLGGVDFGADGFLLDAGVEEGGFG